MQRGGGKLKQQHCYSTAMASLRRGRLDVTGVCHYVTMVSEYSPWHTCACVASSLLWCCSIPIQSGSTMMQAAYQDLLRPEAGSATVFALQLCAMQVLPSCRCDQVQSATFKPFIFLQLSNNAPADTVHATP